MSVRVEGLTKVYGEQKAIDKLSFQVEKGQILGFLGPNGAGKSTTMKILTGYLPPTEGFVEIGGFNVQVNPKEISSGREVMEVRLQRNTRRPEGSSGRDVIFNLETSNSSVASLMRRSNSSVSGP